jgi:hypothetical protein
MEAEKNQSSTMQEEQTVASRTVAASSAAAALPENNDEPRILSAPALPVYLALRQKKIERNLSRLRQLGLLKPNNSSSGLSKKQSGGGDQTLHRKRKPVASGASAGTASTGLRRSTRLRKTPDPSDDVPDQQPASAHDTSLTDDAEPAASSQPSSSAVDCPIKNNPLLPTKSATTKPPVEIRAFPPSNSALSIALDTTKVIDSFLGIRMAATGKAHVMNECARLCRNNGDHGTNVVSFNKYSGVQEWGNDVFFLWINLDAPQSTVENDFSHGTIGWYGGSRHHDGSPVIARLKVARTVLLWCRKYHETAFGPYSLLGRLSVRVAGASAHAPPELTFFFAVFVFIALVLRS